MEGFSRLTRAYGLLAAAVGIPRQRHSSGSFVCACFGGEHGNPRPSLKMSAVRRPACPPAGASSRQDRRWVHHPVIGEKQLHIHCSPIDPNRGLLTAVTGQDLVRLRPYVCMLEIPNTGLCLTERVPQNQKLFAIATTRPHLGPVPQRPPVVHAVVADALPQPQQLGRCPGHLVASLVAALHFVCCFLVPGEGRSCCCTGENWTRRSKQQRARARGRCATRARRWVRGRGRAPSCGATRS